MFDPHQARAWQRRQAELRKEITQLRRGHRAIPLSAEQLVQFFKRQDDTKAWKVEGLPADAHVERTEFDPASGQIVLIVSSSHWPATIFCSLIPWSLTFHRLETTFGQPARWNARGSPWTGSPVSGPRSPNPVLQALSRRRRR